MMKKKLGIFLFMLIWCCGVCLSGAWAADMPWAGGGTEQDPYILQTQQDLQSLAALVNAEETGQSFANTYFKLAADIELP